MQGFDGRPFLFCVLVRNRSMSCYSPKSYVPHITQKVNSCSFSSLRYNLTIANGHFTRDYCGILITISEKTSNNTQITQKLQTTWRKVNIVKHAVIHMHFKGIDFISSWRKFWADFFYICKCMRIFVFNFREEIFFVSMILPFEWTHQILPRGISRVNFCS